MRLLCVILLLCLVAAGPSAAIAISPAYAQRVVTVSTPVKPVVIPAAAKTIVPLSVATTVNPSLWEYVDISSEPSGAAIYVDGSGTSYHTTNTAFKLPPGIHTFRLTHAGYRDYIESVDIQTGVVGGFHAILVPAIEPGIALRQSISAIAPVIPAGVINRTTLTVPVTTTRGMTQCPPDQKCMTLAEAEVAFQPGWEPAGTGPCDTVLNTDNEVIGYRYCIVGNLKPTLQSGAIEGVAVKSPLTMGTPVPNIVCLSGQSCVTTADAAVLFAPGWYYKVDEICGYTGINYTIPKYCVSGSLGPNTTFNCLSGQQCLTLDEAAATLAPGYYYLEGDTCGWEGSAYSPVPKYCISGSPKGSGLQPGAIQSVAVARQVSLVPVSIQTTSTTALGETKKPLGGKRQVGFFDWFQGLFSFMQPVCPSGQSACYGKCVDLMTDSQNCGSCDYTCFDPAVCSGGQCVAPSLPQANVSGLL